MTLILSPNWLGDFIMAIPAYIQWRHEHPDEEVTVVAKRSVAALWSLVERPPEHIITLDKGTKATFKTAFALRKGNFKEAIILPNSFRSALIAFLARVPRRRGTAIHARALLVNDKVRFSRAEAHMHQKFEYLKIFCGTTSLDVAPARYLAPLKPFPLPFADAATTAGATARDYTLVGIVPGAARGASKRWPFFAQAAALILQAQPRTRFLILGTSSEAPVCAEVAEQIGEAAINIAGTTSLTDFIAALAACDCVLCNDSGGMHLASAAGVRVVAVFGITDPDKTGPIGKDALIVRAEGVKVARAIAREDPVAIKALASISPRKVADAYLKSSSTTK